jgi:predicted protein tyrosine phosphatase
MNWYKIAQKNDIQALSVDAAVSALSKSPDGYNVISIRDPQPSMQRKSQYEFIDKVCGDRVLGVYISDTELPEKGDVIPNKQVIQNIINFFDAHKNNGLPWIVHCSHGVSRSAAVAIILGYRKDPKNYLDVYRPFVHVPNSIILDTAIENNALPDRQTLNRDMDEKLMRGFA